MALSRVSRKVATHERILTEASRLLRERGLTGTGVDKVMRAAGLTVGGFYAHFDSKEAMVSEAMGRLLATTRALLFAGLDGESGPAWLRSVLRRYLSRTHRDAVGQGCGFPSVVSEVSRAGPSVRRSFEAGLLPLVDEFARKLPEGPGLTPEERALATFALCVGGLCLARAVDDPNLSERILRACRRLAVPELAAPGGASLPAN